jgi:Fe-S-cluster-containing hydrogenase component 2/CRP-like cAMP-binding protein
MSIPLPARLPLAPRSGDVRLTDELLAELALLSSLQRRPALYRFHGSAALRYYRAGDVVVRQGERYGTAFYALTAADELAVVNALCRSARPRRPDPALLERREALRARAERAAGPEGVLRVVETAPPQLFDGAKAAAPQPVTITVREGEMLGEAACLEGTPRSSTATALRDCYLLEMKADFLAAVQNDPAYRARADAAYRAHVLRLQLARLPVFRELSEQEFGLIGDAVELRTAGPGTVICDEHEPCDGLYLVRAGIVRLTKNVSPLLGRDDVADAGRVRDMLAAGAGGRAPYAALWKHLSEEVRAHITRAQMNAANEVGERDVLRLALNQVLVSCGLHRDPALREFVDGSLPFGKGALSRRQNRLVLEAVLGKALRPLARGVGPEWVLNYCARSDAFGLTDLLLNRPFSATAVASGHPNALGRVELAWLPAESFWQLLREIPRLRPLLKQETARQRRNEERRLATPLWDDGPAQFSAEAVRLGLIQGQQLLLIDLDRCTRCDECVQACATSRKDGHSRLFLEGERFRHHLVPAACRSCLDPVCLIGCPVNSIRRGPVGEIVIEDWCIGCGLCGESCPYGAIQMHDVGIVPESAAGWRFLPGEAAPVDWHSAGFCASKWPESATPFVLDRTTQECLAELGLSSRPRSLAFRYQCPEKSLRTDGVDCYRLEVTSPGAIRVWVNGRECHAADKPRGGRSVYTIPSGVDGILPGPLVVAIEVTLPEAGVSGAEALLQARLDGIHTESVDEHVGNPHGRPIVRRAAVCDLCADEPSGPACIRACPHDAAKRVDGRLALPV